MKPDFKKLLVSLFIFGSIGAVVYIALGSNDLENTWHAVCNMNAFSILGVFLCWFAYLFFDSVGYWIYMKQEGFSISLGRTLLAGLIGFYYSGITPGSAGGQPMQINSFRKAGIPVGYGTMAITVRFIATQTVISLMSLTLYLVNREFVLAQLGDAVWFVRLGWLVNSAAIPLVLLAAFKREAVRKLADGLMRLLHRIHLVHDLDKAMNGTHEMLDTYYTALRALLKHPARNLNQLLCSLLSILGLITTVWFVHLSFGTPGYALHQLLTLAILLYISASYTPLPGAGGAQEGGFLLYYSGVFRSGLAGLALLVWRFFTYYIFLIVGVFAVLLEQKIGQKKNSV